MPYTVRKKDGVLILELNTPGSTVNIFDHHASERLVQILQTVNPSETRAVVFTSGKAFSFINGVGLLLASAVHRPEDGILLSEGTRRAYRAVRECPVPTIAAIRGNCYGCGIEFALNCDYRIAADSFDTHFFMTEMAQYLFIPAFGGTQNLPRLVGLGAAIDLVLWGERWDASTALGHGLVDEVIHPHAFDAGVDRFVAEQAKEKPCPLWGRAPRPDSRSELRAKDRIRGLPSIYRAVYEECLELMVGASRKAQLQADDYRTELLASARSVMTPESKAALSFFFIRQIARGVALRGGEAVSDTWRFEISPSDPRLSTWRQELNKRHGIGLEVVDSLGNDRKDGRGRERRTDFPMTSGEFPLESTVWAASRLRHADLPEGVGIALYAPGLDHGIELVEVVSPRPPGGNQTELIAALARAGFSVVASRGTRPLLNEWVAAFLAPGVAHCLVGGGAKDIAVALREAGFVRGVRELISGLGSINEVALVVAEALPESLWSVGRGDVVAALDDLRKARASARVDASAGHILTAVELSLLAVARRQLRTRALPHPSVADLIAREMFDYPLARLSLCRSLHPDRVREMLSRSAEVLPLIGSPSLEAAREYIASRHQFYY